MSGADIEEVNKALARLAKAATASLDPTSKQAEIFKALGIPKDVIGDFERLVPAVADALRGMEEGTLKVAVAQELLGRSGANMIEFFDLGSTGLIEMGERAKELGIIISGDTANAAAEFNDRLDDLKAAGTGLATQIAAELLPTI